ncbi:MAG TPA: leucyl aminopeptidase [Anaerolineae bacterium]|nr:leucyl aminopeptidase [Anaerolineae bacterium]
MNINIHHASIQAVPADALIVNLFEGVERPAGATGAVDQALGGAISNLIALGDFKGKLNQIAVLYPRGAIPAPRVIVVGLGAVADFSPERIRQAAAGAAKRARDLGAKSIASTAHGAGTGQVEPSLAAQAVVEGTLLGLYEWTEHKSKKSERQVESFTVVEFDPNKLDAIESGVKAGAIIGQAANFARDLINQPPNLMTPTALANTAQERANRVGLKCIVHDAEWIRAQGMGALLGVTQGSAQPPQFIVLEHTGAEGEPLVFVGKGITFDTGGISIKPAEGMEAMKSDMSGAAAVIAALAAIAELNLPIHAVGLVPTCENMPSSTAYRPSDVLRAKNGKTIEVISTDAEGRLILADALSYAAELKPKAVIDLATLTGACVVALGENVAAGYFCNDEALARKVEAASQATAERLWRLPLYDEYRDKIRSDTADVKNTGGRQGGVGSSAVFLEEFTAYPWAHWDIAGVALDKLGATSLYPRTHPPHSIRGGVGFGVRALVELARRWSSP